MSKIVTFLSLGLIVMTVSLSEPVAAQERLVYIRPQVKVSRDHIVLADFVQNPEVLSPSELKLEVLPLNSDEQSRRLSLVGLAYLLQRYRQLHDLQLAGPQTIIVERDMSGQMAERLRQSIEAYLEVTPPWRDWTCRVVLSSADRELLRSLPATVVEFRVNARESRRRLGAVRIRVACLDGDRRVIREFDLYPQIQRRLQAVALRRDVPRGKILEEDDLVLTAIWVDSDVNEYLTAFDQAVNHEVNRSRAAGEFLLRSELLNPVVVKRGDIVWVTATSGGLSVQTSVKALQSGRIGDNIRVQNPTSRKEFSVRITGNRRAQLATR